MKTIRFLMTSDTHAQWLEHPDHPGYSLLNTAYLILSKALPWRLILVPSRMMLDPMLGH